MKNLKEYIIEEVFDIDDNINNVDEAVKEQIKQFLKKNFKNASSCKISDEPNADGKYEVSGKYISTKNKKITSLTNGMFIWANVDGDFSCWECKSLTSLEGAPKEVGGGFYCFICKSLTSLEGAPQKVGRDFNCWGCTSLKSLEGAPKEVSGEFDCHSCALTSLEGAPEKVGGDFSCETNSSLISLEGAPKEVGGNFRCGYCPARFTENDVKKVSNVKGKISI